METVNRRVLLIAIIMALFTSFLVYFYIKKATAKPDVVEYINIYVAAKTLPPKYKVTEADLKQSRVTREYLNPSAVLNKADIIGKHVKDSIIEGEQILRDRLVDENKHTLAFSIPEGKRAVSINVNDQINVSHMLRPGDFVDIIASFDKEEDAEPSGKKQYPRITKTIIQNVKVLALGQEQQVLGAKVAEIPKTITLAVNPNEVEQLVYASEYAVLRLALRPVDDDKQVDTQGIIRGDLTTGKGVRVLP